MGTCGLGPTNSGSYLGSSLLAGETEEVAMRRMNKSNSRIPRVEPSRDWGLIAGMALAMLGLIGMLVYLTQK